MMLVRMFSPTKRSQASCGTLVAGCWLLWPTKILANNQAGQRCDVSWIGGIMGFHCQYSFQAVRRDSITRWVAENADLLNHSFVNQQVPVPDKK